MPNAGNRGECVNQEMESTVGCIVGAVVQMTPAASDDARRQLEQCAGIEIHGEDKQSRLVITMEATTSKAVMKLTEHIQNISGVLQVTPVYQHCEDNQTVDQEGGWKWR